MRKRRNWLKTTIAMLTLIATVLETGFSSVSTLAAEIQTEDGIIVNNDAIEDSYVDSDAGNSDDLSISVERDADSQPEETGDSFVQEENTINYEQEEQFEEAAELKEGSLDVTDNGITGSGYNEISIYVDTENLSYRKSFRIEFFGPSDASYNTIINDDLFKTNDGRYDFENLEGEEFTVRATSEDKVILSYRYNEDGYPTIVVENEPVEKKLEKKTVYFEDGTEAAAITGQGYESLKLNFNTEELSDKASYKLVVDSEVEPKVDGEDAKDGIRGLDSTLQSLVIEDLEEEEFTAYILSDNEEIEIQALADIDNVEEGEATFTVDNIDVKRVYEYEDDKVKVTATLEKADAVPDDADFVVTEVVPESTDYNYETYMSALNENAEEITEADPEDVEFNEENTLLYDIAFFVEDENGTKVEFEPEEGTVNFVIEFKRGQLSESKNDAAISVVHMPLADAVKNSVDTTADATEITTNDVKVENIYDNLASVANEMVEFDLNSLSVIAIIDRDHDENNGSIEATPGAEITAKDLLQEAWYYGITANNFNMTGGGDGETNFAAKEVSNTGWSQTGMTAARSAGSKHAYYIIGGFTGNNLIFKDNIERTLVLPTGNNFENKFSKENEAIKTNKTYMSKTELDGSINSMISVVESASADMATRNSVTSTSYDNYKLYNSKITLDLSGKDPGTYYINVDDIEPIRNALEQTGQFKLVKDKGQKVVFNFSGTTVNLKKFLFNNTDSDAMNAKPESESNPIGDIVFNMPNATTVNMSTVAGVFIAPNATVNVADSGGGWIVANTVNISCEWHFTNSRVPDKPSGNGKLEIPVTKYFINGENNWGDGF